MQKSLVRKGLVLGIIFLFVGAGVVPSISGNIGKIVSIENSKSNATLFKTIIVPDDYPTIQDAIDNATDDDTIFVRNGIYYENILVNKSIILIGENKNNTIIDGNGNVFVINISDDFVQIMGFTIQNADKGIFVFGDFNNMMSCIITDNSRVGINIEKGSHNNIMGNNIVHNGYGIDLESYGHNVIYGNNISWNVYGNRIISDYNRISGNIFFKDNWMLEIFGDYNEIFGNIFSHSADGYSIKLFGSYTNITGNTITDSLYGGIETLGGSDYNIISNNIIKNSELGYGIYLSSNNNKVIGNIIKNNRGISGTGISLRDSSGNIIMGNTLTNNTQVLLLTDRSNNNRIYCNNFYYTGTGINQVSFSDCRHNKYLKNYWNAPRIIPKIIWGQIGGLILWLAIDPFPAYEPYQTSNSKSTQTSRKCIFSWSWFDCIEEAM